MVIGNGLIAKSFHHYKTKDEFVVFASGVSDSKSSTENDFKREQDLLITTIKNNLFKRIVYFSTCSITDDDLKQTDYVKHKINIENLIKAAAPRFQIFRLSNLAGITHNPHTVLNFFYFHITEGRHFDLWKNSERNIIDVEDVYKIADHILQNNLFPNQVINIANDKNYSVKYIVNCIENVCHKKANFTEKEKGAKLVIDIGEIQPILRSLEIKFDDDYLPKLLLKYYQKHDL